MYVCAGVFYVCMRDSTVTRCSPHVPFTDALSFIDGGKCQAKESEHIRVTSSFT